jgi:hydroxymethylbilane synthase
MSEKVKIGTRGSKLALWQAEWVREELSARFPAREFVLEIIKTTGDVQQDVSLTSIGGQGVFTKELEGALLRGEIDLAVHSLKDLPSSIPLELTIAAVTKREDPRDALVPRLNQQVPGKSLLDLAPGAVVGTSSPRRAAQLRVLRPDLTIKELRGNIDTRLRKLDAGDYDYIVLACAGLRRLGWADRIGFPISTREMLPAVGQGALGIEIRTGDASTFALLRELNHFPTAAACLAERSFLRAAGGGCQLPLTAHGLVIDAELTVIGLLIEDGGATDMRRLSSGPVMEAESIGEDLAVAMLREWQSLAGSSLRN